MAFTLRTARLDDADATALVARLQAWYVDLYGGEDEDPLDADGFAAPHGGFVLGEQDGTPVAMGGWTSTQHDGLPAAKLRRMFVVPESQRGGLATRVLEALEQDAAAAGARWLVLETGAPQTAAVAFYRARGYRDVAPFGFYAAMPEAVHLGKPLLTEA